MQLGDLRLIFGDTLVAQSFKSFSLPSLWLPHPRPGRTGPDRFKGSLLPWATTWVPRIELFLLLISWNICSLVLVWPSFVLTCDFIFIITYQLPEHPELWWYFTSTYELLSFQPPGSPCYLNLVYNFFLIYIHKEAPCPAWSPVWGLNTQPWGQESDP